MLTTLIDEVCKTTGINLKQLEAIAVSAGPGSYTGLRIGASVAKGLCYGLNKPLIAVSTLAALAEGIKEKIYDKETILMPVIDAGRNEIYTALYRYDGTEIWAPAPVLLLESLKIQLDGLGKITIGGNATDKCKAFFKEETIKFSENVLFDSKLMTTIAYRKHLTRTYENPAYFEPHYLKNSYVKP